MGFLPKQRNHEEQKAFEKKIKPGKYMLIYNSPVSWGMYLADDKPFLDRNVVLINRNYDAPGSGYRRNLSYIYETERYMSDGPVISTYQVMMLYDTEEEANAIVENIMALMEIYNAEIAEPLLKLEMGIAVQLEQGLGY
jgi:hypothetical protein